MSSPTLHGKTTLITGATAGIGRATARVFAAAGSDIVLLARDRRRLAAEKEGIESAHRVRVQTVEQDICCVRESYEKLELVASTCALDIVIVNAAVGHYGPFVRATWDNLQTVIDTNFSGAVATVRAVLPFMVQRNSGSIVFVSSVLGKRAVQWNAVYSATKHALCGLADALRQEVKNDGIHVGVVYPARTATEFSERMLLSSSPPQKRKLPTSPPDRVARAILRHVRYKRRETVVSLSGKLYATVGYHFPRLTDFLFSLSVPTPRYE